VKANEVTAAEEGNFSDHLSPDPSSAVGVSDLSL